MTESLCCTAKIKCNVVNKKKMIIEKEKPQQRDLT